MSHHTLVARLGTDDNSDLQLSRQSTHLTEINFLKENGKLDFGLGQALNGLSDLGLTPMDVSVDLALLAATVTAADTRISRGHNAQDLWTREIALYIPVASPTLWNSQTGLLSRMLNFLTGDRWTIHFRSRPVIEHGLIQRSSKERSVNPTSVCLFSGGSTASSVPLIYYLMGEPPSDQPLLGYDYQRLSAEVCSAAVGAIWTIVQPCASSCWV